MKKDDSGKNTIRQILEGRAARIFAGTVSAFLCALTLLEFAALRHEWEVPVLQALSGENGFWSEEYQREELALDDSTENEILEEIICEEKAAGADSVDDAEVADIGVQTDSTGATGTGMQTDNTEATEQTAPVEEQNAGDVTDSEAEPEFPYYIRINRKQNCITIYTLDEEEEYTVPCKAMICSTGLYNATPRGVYQISTKYRWRELYGNVYGQYATRIHGGVLFHSVPYYRKAENALCTEKYNKLGQQASMGCVRLTVEDAKWIAENCPEGTTVEIYDDDDPGPLGRPEAIKIDTDNPNKGWDPTDPKEENPWHELSEDE